MHTQNVSRFSLITNNTVITFVGVFPFFHYVLVPLYKSSRKVYKFRKRVHDCLGMYSKLFISCTFIYMLSIFTYLDFLLTIVFDIKKLWRQGKRNVIEIVSIFSFSILPFFDSYLIKFRFLKPKVDVCSHFGRFDSERDWSLGWVEFSWFVGWFES